MCLTNKAHNAAVIPYVQKITLDEQTNCTTSVLIIICFCILNFLTSNSNFIVYFIISNSIMNFYTPDMMER